jgi:hypothetical protein
MLSFRFGRPVPDEKSGERAGLGTGEVEGKVCDMGVAATRAIGQLEPSTVDRTGCLALRLALERDRHRQAGQTSPRLPGGDRSVR